MAMPEHAIYWEPARKLFLNQLKFLRKSLPNNLNHTIKFKNKEIPVVQVWIQGVVMAKDTETLIIDDTTGRATITNIRAVPCGSNWIEKGMYITVIGTIKDLEASVIEAEKLKPCPIKNNGIAIWKMEVLHFWNFLAR